MSFELKGKYTTATIYLPDGSLDKNTLSQIKQLTDYKAFTGLKLVVMPDCHAGAGCVIGTTVDMSPIVNSDENSEETGIIPNIIGVDIGCGVESVNLGTRELDYESLDKYIHHHIPAGFSKRPSPFSFEFLSSERRKYYQNLENEAEELCKRIGVNPDIFYRSIGTLGGGNHFIEIGLADEEDEKGNRNRWLSIHSGSRNPGLQVAKHYQDIAKEYWKNYVITSQDTHRQEIHALQKKLGEERKPKNYIKKEVEKLKQTWQKLYNPPKGAEFLPLHLGGMNYLRDMKLMQQFAELNREVMLNQILQHLKIDAKPEDYVRSVHNYINFDDNILRKGAISAHKDQNVVIPMNMKRGIIIGKGLGNADWNYSAPHGSGRVMSRGQAKQMLSLRKFEQQMEKVYSTCVDKNRLDEAPDVYKDADMICRQIDGETVQIVYNVRAEYNFKG